jgi:hypothetical protein
MTENDDGSVRVAFYRDEDGVLRDFKGRPRPDVEGPGLIEQPLGLEREGWDIPPEAA